MFGHLAFIIICDITGPLAVANIPNNTLTGSRAILGE
jgi:hypothetical protein